MIDGGGPSARATELAQEFDLSFAQPVPPQRAQVDLMLIRVAGQVYAVRLSEVATIRADARITACPSRNVAFSGVAGIRGSMVPIWDLALLLGHTSGGAGRWLFMPSAGTVGLAFDAFERHRRVGADAVKKAAGGDARGHMREVLEDEGAVFPLIDVAFLVSAIRTAARNASE